MSNKPRGGEGWGCAEARYLDASVLSLRPLQNNNLVTSFRILIKTCCVRGWGGRHKCGFKNNIKGR